MSLVTTRNIVDQDGVYAALIDAHKGLSETESAAFNARLILILLNQIGDATIIEEALALARRSGEAARG